jgi:hypothetical protein
MRAASPAVGTAARYVVCYVLWAVSLLLSLLDLVLARETLQASARVFRWGPWWHGAIMQWGFTLMAVVWLVYAILSEGYLRGGLKAGDLRKRSAFLITALVVVAAALNLLQLVMR